MTTASAPPAHKSYPFLRNISEDGYEPSARAISKRKCPTCMKRVRSHGIDRTTETQEELGIGKRCSRCGNFVIFYEQKK